MKLATLQAGQFVETGGYYVKGDAGQAKYLIVAAQAADEYGDHTLANGVVAVLQSNRHLKLSQYGVVTSGDMQPNANAALNKLQTGEKLEFDVAELTIHSTILREDMPDNTHIDLGNCIIHPDTPAMADQRMLALTGVQEDHGTIALIDGDYTEPVPPAANIYTLGVKRFRVADVTGIQAGDRVQFHSIRDFDLAGNKETYETQRVWEVDAINNRFWTDAESKVAFVTGDTVQFWGLTKGLTVTGGTFDLDGNAESGLFLTGFNQPVVRNVKIIGNALFGIYVRDCCEDDISHCTFQKAGDPTSPDAGYAGQFGYGLIHAYSCYSRVSNCIGYEGWHSFEAADGQRDITYTDCMVLSDGHGFSTHENCVSVSYINCRSQARLPIITRARYLTIQGGEYVSTNNDASFSFSGWAGSITGAKIKSEVTGTMIRANAMGILGTEPVTPPVRFTMANCILEFGTSCTVALGNESCDELVISNNTFFMNGISGNYNLLIAQKLVVTNNIFTTKSNSAAVQFVAQDGYFLRNIINKADTVSTTSSDLITIFPLSGFVSPMKLKIQDNVYTGNVRYVCKSNVVLPEDLEITCIRDSWHTTGGRIFIGPMTLSSYYNIAGDFYSTNLIYGQTFGPVLDKVIGDLILSKGTEYYDSMPTSSGSVGVGDIWNNAGVVSIKV